MQESIYSKGLNGHHDYWASGIEGCHEELLDFLLFMDGLEHVQHIVLSGRFMSAPVPFVQVSQLALYGLHYACQLVNESICKDCAFVPMQGVEIVLKSTGHF